jgi:phage gpG-like protein
VDLRTLAGRVRDAAEAAGRAGSAEVERLAVEGMRESIETSTAPDGTPYPPLKRPRADGSTKPLTRDGLLAASLSARYASGELVLSSDHPAAKFQDAGTRTVPRRRFLGVSFKTAAKMAAGVARAWAAGFIDALRGG